MPDTFQDFRYAARALAKKPGFTLLTVTVLALGIGANVALFSVIYAVLLRPLPYPHPEQLVSLRERSGPYENSSVAYPNYLDWRQGQRTCVDLALYRGEGLNLSFGPGQAEPERVRGARVTGNFCAVLGVRPQVGRDFTEAEDQAGGPRAVLLSDGLWRRRFGADPAALGRTLTIDGQAHEIVGVLPRGVALPRGAEVYVPLGEMRADPAVLDRDEHPGFTGLGRLRPGQGTAAAAADLDAIARELARRYPDTNTRHLVQLRPLLEQEVGQYRQSFSLLMGAVGGVLLITCANAAGLLLARATGRRQELATRVALGANRRRLTGLLLAESGLLALAGAAVGTLLALASLEVIRRLAPANLPRLQQAGLDWPVLAFAGLLAGFVGLAVGTWPTWRLASVAAVTAALREGGTRGGGEAAGRQRVRAVLVVAQIAVALVLLAVAAVLLREFWSSQAQPLGFDPRGILQLTVALPAARYDRPEKVAGFYDQLLERVRALPGVAGAAVGNNVPFDNYEWDGGYHVTGRPPDVPGEKPSAEVCFTAGDYFRTMGMPVLRGRDFRPSDWTVHGSWAIIVDESFACQAFPGQDPVGQHVDNEFGLEKNVPPMTIVGVVPRTRNDAPGERSELYRWPQMYVYATPPPAVETVQNVLVRVSGGRDPRQLAAAVKRQVLALDPAQPVADVTTMEDNVAASLAPRRLTLSLLGAFAALALGLSSVGLYGVTTLNVARRTRELGIRLALGAGRDDVFRLVLGQGAKLVGLGLGLGLIGALGASRLVRSLLVGSAALDPGGLAAAGAILAGAALLACWVPARRATRVDPLVALREE